MIEDMIKECNICKKTSKSNPCLKHMLPKVVNFNQVVTLDLKQIKDEKGRKVHILYMICSFSRLAVGRVIRDKHAETMLEALNNGWNWMYRFLSRGFWSNNGKEFVNKDMRDLCSRMNLSIGFTTPWSPYSNGINERNHASIDKTVEKLMMEHSNMELQTLVNMACWTHNTSLSVKGFTPLTLATGKSIIQPGLS